MFVAVFQHVVFASAGSLFVCLWYCAAMAEAPDSKSRDAEESEQTTRVIQAELPRWKMWSGTERRRELRLEPKSVLRWTNPGTQRVYGDVFLWTLDGRPEVVMSLFKVWEPPRGLHAEMHSLSPGEVTAERNDAVFWRPPQSGIVYKDVPDSAAPADSAVRRLQQMRNLARDFSAELVDQRVNESGERQVLRLLPQPIYRYESTDPEVIDGALFAIVLGTDPEVFLVIEARRIKDDVRWRYALARMNSDEMVVRYKEHEVWRVARSVSREALRDAYFLSGIREGR